MYEPIDCMWVRYWPCLSTAACRNPSVHMLTGYQSRALTDHWGRASFIVLLYCELCQILNALQSGVFAVYVHGLVPRYRFLKRLLVLYQKDMTKHEPGRLFLLPGAGTFSQEFVKCVLEKLNVLN